VQNPIRIYPVPTIDKINIERVNTGDEIILRNIFGEELRKIISKGEKIEINVTEYPPGIYYIQSKDALGKIIKM